jgi:four helix bundle protein
MTIRSYQDLDVWKKSLHLVKTTYSLIANFPASERYGLTSQIQRAAISIPANIAEGRGRSSRKEFLYFLKVACGSLAELETHLFIAIELGYLTPSECSGFFTQTAEIGRMLNGLINALKAKSLKPGTRNLEPV